jgi:transcriptional regulator with XRE-family HTH domain
VVERIAFGQRLRRERDRRGVRLETIAQSTKIKASLFDALERGDFSQWPAGIFGRGFLRAYLTAIGLPTEAIVAEFQLLSAAAPGSARADGRDADGLRLTLDPGSDGMPAMATRLGAAATEAAVVLAAAGLASELAGVNFWIAATVTASIGSAVTTLWLGRSPVLWLAARRKPPTDSTPIYLDTLPEADSDLKLTLARE